MKPSYKIVQKTDAKPILKRNIACRCGKIFNGYDRIIQKSFHTDLCESCYLKEKQEQQPLNQNEV